MSFWRRMAGAGLGRRIAFVGIGGAMAAITAVVALSPNIDAGADAAADVGIAEVLNGTCPNGKACTWTQESGDGTCEFTDASSADTVVTCDTATTAVLRLTVNGTTTYNEMELTVSATDQSPIVNAGPDDTITEDSEAYLLQASCSDDVSATCTWAENDGDGICNFIGDATDFTCDATSTDLEVICDTAAVTMTLTLTCDDGQNDPVVDSVDLAVVAAGAGAEFTASRTSGIEPLAVFFGLEAGANWHDSRYSWDFDDADAGNWARGGSRDAHRGPDAAHVFEGAETFTVALSSPAGSFGDDVVVTGADAHYSTTATVCFSNTSTFTDCPAGATQVSSSSDLSDLAAHLDTDKRLLLRGGDTWTRDSTLTINETGPVHIGSFGTGKATITAASGNIFSVGTTAASSDIRFVDIVLDGPGGDNTVVGVSLGGRATNILALRVDFTGVRNAFLADYNSYETDLTQAIPAGLTVHDCTVPGADEYAWYASATDFSYQGNVVQRETAGQSCMRQPWSNRGIVANNILGPCAGSSGHLGYFIAPSFDEADLITTGQKSHHVQIADNTFQLSDPDAVIGDDSGVAWTVHIGCQNVSSDERWEDLLVERNWFVGVTDTQYALHLGCQIERATLRDNIIYGERSGTDGAFRIDPGGSLGASPDSVAIVHNTCYSVGTGGCRLLNVALGATNVTGFNNFVIGASADDIAGTGSWSSSSDNVLTTVALANLSTEPPVEPDDYCLAASSPALDTGAAAYAGTPDYFGTPRSGSPDVGMCEDAAANQAPTVSAGGDDTATVDVAYTLDATCSDDGNPIGDLDCAWTQTAGAGACVFENIGLGAGNCDCTADDCDLDVTCDTEEAVTLEFACSDSDLSDDDTVVVTVGSGANAQDELQADLEALWPGGEIELMLLGEDATVTEWPDRSSNGNDLPACTGVPVPTTGGQGTRSYVAFNGTDDCYELAGDAVVGMGDTEPYAALVVFDPDTTDLNLIMLDCVNTASGGVKPRVVNDNDVRFQTQTDGDINDQEIDSSVDVSGSAQIYMGWYDVTDGTAIGGLTGDGDQICVELDGEGTTCLDTSSVTLRTGPLNDCYVGVRAPTKSQWFNGKLYFIMVVRTTDLAALNSAAGLLETYYGLTLANVP